MVGEGSGIARRWDELRSSTFWTSKLVEEKRWGEGMGSNDTQDLHPFMRFITLSPALALLGEVRIFAVTQRGSNYRYHFGGFLWLLILISVLFQDRSLMGRPLNADKLRRDDG